jgi:predicted flap endonuclease-1-like 5' DNA nuclease
MTKLTAIEGIGETYAATLAEAGITTTEHLLDSCATPKGRTDLAASTGISKKLVLKWANRADLARIKGIGEEYADLLEYSGVDTVPDLARRVPENLHAKMVEVNDEKSLVRQTPSLKSVTDWIGQAKELPRIMTY